MPGPVEQLAQRAVLDLRVVAPIDRYARHDDDVVEARPRETFGQALTRAGGVAGQLGREDAPAAMHDERGAFDAVDVAGGAFHGERIQHTRGVARFRGAPSHQPEPAGAVHIPGVAGAMPGPALDLDLRLVVAVAVQVSGQDGIAGDDDFADAVPSERLAIEIGAAPGTERRAPAIRPDDAIHRQRRDAR